VYLFAGGLAGASAGLAFASEVGGHDVLARRAWGVAGVAVTACPPLLVSDLGRPERFLNMMRVFKVTSPMSVGSWLLAAAGTATGAAAASRLLAPRRGGSLASALERIGSPAAPAAAVLGMPLATYTGVLLANTAVPVWHEARRELPFLFAAGAAASAGAAATAITPAAHAGPARRLAVGAAIAEMAIDRAMHRRLGPLAATYESGPPARWHRAAVTLLTAGAATLAASGRRAGPASARAGRLRNPRRAAAPGGRPLAVAGAALTLGGAFATRFAVFRAGFASAEDPAQTVAPQRARAAAA
jgi:formate-dependent nitrite reductase membrane component NrfD